MVILYCFITFIFTSAISPALSEEENSETKSSSENAMGTSACMFYGNVVEGECELDTLLCGNTPQECSAYIWPDVRVDLTYDVYNRNGPYADKQLKELVKCAKKPVYILYGHSGLMEWSQVLACKALDGANAKDEVDGLRAYLEEFKSITGIILTMLDIVPEAPSFECFTENLRAYIEVFRKELPELKIAIFLYADQLIMHYKNPVVNWIDFNVLKDDFDNVLVSYNNFFKECSPKLLNQGLTEISGESKYSVEKAVKFLIKAGVPKEKLHLIYETYPYSDQSPYASLCEVSYSLMCQDPKKSSCWCSDTMATYYDKGNYAKKNAYGFVVSSLEGDDSLCDCKCGHPFPAFYAIYSGFHEASLPASCPLIDRC